MIAPQFKFDIKSEIAIDKIAGVGCASTGIEMTQRTHATVHFAARHEVIE